MEVQINTPAPGAADAGNASKPITPSPAPGASPAPAAAAVEDKSAVAEVQKAQDAQDPEFSKKFAALSREQKKLFVKEQELKTRESKLTDWEKRQELKKTNRLEYLKSEGIELDDLVKELLSSEDNKPTTDDRVAALEKEIKEYKAQEARQKEEAEQKKIQAQNQMAIDAWMTKAKNEIGANADKYETIIAQNAYQTVFDVVQEYYEKHNTILPIDKAADLVEEHLFDDVKKLAGHKKLKSLFVTTENKEASVEASTKTAPQEEKKPAPTLNSALTPSLIASEEGGRKLTREESLREAAKMIKFT
jgi:hypothetical protein